MLLLLLSETQLSELCPPSSPCDRPRVIESLRGVEVVDVAAGGAHSACITSSGELYTWGKGRYGRLGHGDSEDQLKPKLVGVLLSALWSGTLCWPVAWSGALEISKLLWALESTLT